LCLLGLFLFLGGWSSPFLEGKANVEFKGVVGTCKAIQHFVKEGTEVRINDREYIFTEGIWHIK
jgi:hypothetical protein